MAQHTNIFQSHSQISAYICPHSLCYWYVLEWEYTDLFVFTLGTNMEKKKEDHGTAAATSTVAISPDAMPVPKIKHDWYQTEAFVIVTVLVKNLKKEDVKIDFTEKTVSTRSFP